MRKLVFCNYVAGCVDHWVYYPVQHADSACRQLGGRLGSCWNKCRWYHCYVCYTGKTGIKYLSFRDQNVDLLRFPNTPANPQFSRKSEVLKNKCLKLLTIESRARSQIPVNPNQKILWNIFDQSWNWKTSNFFLQKFPAELKSTEIKGNKIREGVKGFHMSITVMWFWICVDIWFCLPFSVGHFRSPKCFKVQRFDVRPTFEFSSLRVVPSLCRYVKISNKIQSVLVYFRTQQARQN